MNPLNPDWKPIPLTDDEIQGHYKWQVEELGMDTAKCPTCTALTRGGICLNACHLSAQARKRFNALVSSFGEEEL